MNKRLVFLVCLLIAVSAVYFYMAFSGKTVKIDAKMTPAAYNRLAVDEIKNNRHLAGRRYYLKAIKLAEKQEFKKDLKPSTLGDIYYNLGLEYKFFGKYKKEIAAYKKSVEIFEDAIKKGEMKPNDEVYLSAIYMKAKRSPTKNGEKELLKIYDKIEKSGKTDILGYIVRDLADIYIYQKKDFQKGRKYLKQGLEIANAKNIKQSKAEIYARFGEINIFENDFSAAEKNLEKSLEIYKNINSKLNNDFVGLPYVHRDLAFLNLKGGRCDLAIKHYNEFAKFIIQNNNYDKAFKASYKRHNASLQKCDSDVSFEEFTQ